MTSSKLFSLVLMATIAVCISSGTINQDQATQEDFLQRSLQLASSAPSVSPKGGKTGNSASSAPVTGGKAVDAAPSVAPGAGGGKAADAPSVAPGTGGKAADAPSSAPGKTTAASEKPSALQKGVSGKDSAMPTTTKVLSSSLMPSIESDKPSGPPKGNNGGKNALASDKPSSDVNAADSQGTSAPSGMPAAGSPTVESPTSPTRDEGGDLTKFTPAPSAQAIPAGQDKAASKKPPSTSGALQKSVMTVIAGVSAAFLAYA